MEWIVIGEKNGKISLVSKGDVNGLLPKGSYLTIDQGEQKFILRVDESSQNESYSPSPMIVDMDLSPMSQDQKCQNIVQAYRVKTITDREDGLIDYIKPQMSARRSTQEEIDIAMESEEEGPRVFVATVHRGQNQLLMDENRDLITARLPKSMFYHQMLVCGKTGSGKTVSTKYLAQHFVEKMGGAVLAINVKDTDFLKMDKGSETKKEQVKKEWENMKGSPHGIENFTVYYPANASMNKKGVNSERCYKVTLNVQDLDPEAFTGLMRGITDIATQNLPNIFRYWKENNPDGTFSDFLEYFKKAEEDKLKFPTLNSRKEESEVKLARGTYDNIMRKLTSAAEFFDNKNAKSLDSTDILIGGKMSVIDVANKNGIEFGSVLLRDLLHRIVESKSLGHSEVPILIIIDEVHQFYGEASSTEALGDLDTICRTGRSQEIGVIFSSQNPSDIPRGLSSVINTKIFFKTDVSSLKSFGLNISPQEMESLSAGYAASSIHDMSQLKIIKFPMAYAGVFEKNNDNGK